MSSSSCKHDVFKYMYLNLYLFTAPWTACESSPCDNGASCVDVNVDTFICVFRDGFFGVACSQSKIAERQNKCVISLNMVFV